MMERNGVDTERIRVSGIQSCQLFNASDIEFNFLFEQTLLIHAHYFAHKTDH